MESLTVRLREPLVADTVLEGDGLSDLELLQERNAGAHLLQIHFDEIILDAADFCRAEDFLPIQRALPHCYNFLGFRRPALHMHGNEAAGILGEIFRGVVTLANGRYLELEFDEFRIQKLEQNIVGSFAVHGRKLELFVMKTLLDARFRGAFGHFVVFVSGTLHVVHRGILWAAERGHKHLGEADILCPPDAVLLVLAQLANAEMRADAGNARIAQDFAKLRRGIFRKSAEAELLIAIRRTQLDRLEASVSKLLDGAGEILGDR